MEMPGDSENATWAVHSMVNIAMEKSIDYKIYVNLSKELVRNKPKLSAELS